MAATYTWRSGPVLIEPNTDLIAQVCNVASDCRAYAKVHRVDVRRLNPMPATSIPGNQTLQILTSSPTVSGGTAITATPMDDTSSALPSQVSFTALPSLVTGTATTTRRVVKGPFVQGIATATSLFAESRAGFGSRARRSGCFGSAFSSLVTGADEPISLQAGEGLALFQTLASLSFRLAVRVLIRIAATGECWNYFAPIVGVPRGGISGGTNALFCLMNASGSGVVVQVLEIDVMEMQPGPFAVTNMRLARTSGVPLYSGAGSVNGTAIPHNSTDAALSDMTLTAGPALAALIGQDLGVNVNWYKEGGGGTTLAAQQAYGTYRSFFNPITPMNVALATLFPNVSKVFEVKKNADLPIRLNKNEGLAVLMGRAGAIEPQSICFYEIEFLMTYTPAPAASGSGISRSRVVGRL